jgi:hypothetical protein
MSSSKDINKVFIGGGAYCLKCKQRMQRFKHSPD